MKRRQTWSSWNRGSQWRKTLFPEVDVGDEEKYIVGFIGAFLFCT